MVFGRQYITGLPVMSWREAFETGLFVTWPGDEEFKKINKEYWEASSTNAGYEELKRRRDVACTEYRRRNGLDVFGIPSEELFHFACHGATPTEREKIFSSINKMDEKECYMEIAKRTLALAEQIKPVIKGDPILARAAEVWRVRANGFEPYEAEKILKTAKRRCIHQKHDARGEQAMWTGCKNQCIKVLVNETLIDRVNALASALSYGEVSCRQIGDIYFSK